MSTAIKTLGKRLKELRKLANLTLRDVEIETGISNPYLSQLEHDKIKRPSAQSLYMLSKVYAVDINDLLYHSGLIIEPPARNKLFRTVAEKSGELTAEEETELIEYLKFIRFKNKQ